MKVSNLLKKSKPSAITDITILVASELLDLIEIETKLYAKDGLETGGVVVGGWLDQTTAFLAAATGSGPRANHEAFSFAIDTEHANAELARLTQKYPNTNYIGEWHKHPPTLERPSSGDLRTARTLLADPDYPNRLINPISLVQDGKVIINFFYISKNIAEFVHLAPQGLSEIDAHSIGLPPANYHVYHANIKMRQVAEPPKPMVWWLAGASALVGVLAVVLVILNLGENNKIGAERAMQTQIAVNLATITANAALPTTNFLVANATSTVNFIPTATIAKDTIAAQTANNLITVSPKTTSTSLAATQPQITATPIITLPQTSIATVTTKAVVTTAPPPPVATPKLPVPTDTSKPALPAATVAPTATPKPAPTSMPSTGGNIGQVVIVTDYKLTLTELTPAEIEEIKTKGRNGKPNYPGFSSASNVYVPWNEVIGNNSWLGNSSNLLAPRGNAKTFVVITLQSDAIYQLTIQGKLAGEVKFNTTPGKKYELQIQKI